MVTRILLAAILCPTSTTPKTASPSPERNSDPFWECYCNTMSERGPAG
jgi:hypothetical protein